jgi:hypothetical protein
MMKEMIGALYFSDEPPHITGHLKLGDEHYQISGVRVSEIRAVIKALAIGDQEDLFKPKGTVK